ncbi:class I SAM-dependent methyltransferase [Streptomyces sp. NPDC058676]
MREFLRHTRLTGAVAPSSATLAQATTVGLDLEHADVVVELGSGTGAITEAIRRRLAPGTRLVAVELNPVFARRLADRCRDSTVEVVHGSAEDLPALVPHPVDAVVSGLPAVDRHAARAAAPDPRRGDRRIELGRPVQHLPPTSTRPGLPRPAGSPPNWPRGSPAWSAAGSSGRISRRRTCTARSRRPTQPFPPPLEHFRTGAHHDAAQHVQHRDRGTEDPPRYFHECARERRRRGHCRPTARCRR